MKTVVLNADVSQKKFGELVTELAPGEVQVVDPEGRVLAYVTRLPQDGDSIYRALAKQVAGDAAELRRRQREATTGRDG